MASSLSPSSAPPLVSRTLTHHVFISFCGTDVRKNLLTHILGEFKRKGITPFLDNEMERGASIGPELLDAIKAARISIVIFSRNYASSSWCLNELVEVMKCKDKTQIVMTIFHQVKPTDVRHQKGVFGEAFEKTCAGKSEEVKRVWRKVLTDAANIHGDAVESDEWKSEADMVATIATDVLNKLMLTRSKDFDDYVGLQAHLKNIDSMLCSQTDEVRMIGIWGPPGIGKTTISRVLLNELSSKFELSARIGDIKRRHSSHHDVYQAKVELKKELFSNLFKDKGIEIPHLGVTKERFNDKKVLVILDDVNESWQLEATVKPEWFGAGSRIIITTQDRRVLEKHGIKDDDMYKMDYPTKVDSLQIFCKYAFNQKYPQHGFEDLAKQVTELATNLPLALHVMGSHFKKMSMKRWKMELEHFKKTGLHKDILDILKLSYEALGVEEKNLFNDIACIFNGENINTVEEIIGDGFNRNLTVLEEKSLISLYEGRIGMHTLLAKLGREELQGCTVLVNAQKICRVLGNNTETVDIRGIKFNLSEIGHELEIDKRAFERMFSLEYLQIHDADSKLRLPQDLMFLPDKLKLLHWYHCPMKAMPSNFRPEFLVKLIMEGSKLEKLWEGIQPLRSLKEINLSGSMKLKEIPNLSDATSLKRLMLHYCGSLVEIPSSIGNATNLEMIGLGRCSMVELPSSIGNLNKLKTLNLIGTNLEAFPTNINLTSLSELDVSDSRLKMFPEVSTNIKKLTIHSTKIKEVPSSIMYWSRLRMLNMNCCRSLKVFPPVPDSIESLYLSYTGIEEVPPSIQNLSRLTTLNMRASKLKLLPANINLESLSHLDLSRCEKLKMFPEISTSIVYLHLSDTAIKEVPPSIKNLSRLTFLDMVGCKLKVLPANINLDSLARLDLSNCTVLKTFPEISTSIEYLHLSNTAIEKVPSSIWSWYRLRELNLTDCKSLKVFPPIPDNIEDCNQKFPQLLKLHLNGCKNLVSLPQLPDSLSILNADNCKSLERIEGSFHNQKISLHFANCFNLNREARDLIQESDCKFSLLPFNQEPLEGFDQKAKGDFVTLDLDQRPIPLFLRFKACLLLLHGTYSSKDHDYFDVVHQTELSCHISCIQNNQIIGSGFCKYYIPSLVGFKEHLYFFDSSISLNFPGIDVNFSKLQFEFFITGTYWKIEGCGVRLLEDLGDFDDHEWCREISNETEYKESADITILEKLPAETLRRSCNPRFPSLCLKQKYAEESRYSIKMSRACVLAVLLCANMLGFVKILT